MPNKFIGFFKNILGNEISETTKEEITDYDKEDRRYKLRYNNTYLSSRKWYGFFTFFIVSLWLGVMLYFILAQGLGHLPCKGSKFSLTEPVIIAVITTTTINVLALLIIVLRSLFPSNDKDAPTGQ